MLCYVGEAAFVVLSYLNRRRGCAFRNAPPPRFSLVALARQPAGQIIVRVSIKPISLFLLSTNSFVARMSRVLTNIVSFQR